MKYPIGTVGSSDSAHVVPGKLPKVATNPVNVRLFKLNAGGGSTDITAQIDTGNGKSAVAIAGGPEQTYTFDIKDALNTNYQAQFPAWGSYGVLVEFYETVVTKSNTAVAKVCLGGEMDQIENIGGDDHLTLGDLNDKIVGANIWSALTGVNYDNNGEDADKTTHTLTLTPYLHKGGRTVNDAFLQKASISVRDVDGGVDVITEIVDENSENSVLNGSINDVVTVVTVADGSAFSNGLAVIDEEIVDITGITGNDLTITRAQSGTVATTHDNGAAIYKSGADANGFFSCSKVDCSALAVDTVYGVVVKVTHKGQDIESHHTFTLRENDI